MDPFSVSFNDHEHLSQQQQQQEGQSMESIDFTSEEDLSSQSMSLLDPSFDSSAMHNVSPLSATSTTTTTAGTTTTNIIDVNDKQIKQQSEQQMQTGNTVSLLDGLIGDESGGLVGTHVIPTYVQRLGEERSISGRGTLLTALYRTRNIAVLQEFVDSRDGLTVFATWLLEHKNKPKLMKFICKVLLQLPVTIEALRRSGIGKIAKKLSKAQDITDHELKQRLHNCLEKWVSLAQTVALPNASGIADHMNNNNNVGRGSDRGTNGVNNHNNNHNHIQNIHGNPTGGSNAFLAAGASGGGSSIFAKLSSGTSPNQNFRIPKKSKEQRERELDRAKKRKLEDGSKDRHHQRHSNSGEKDQSPHKRKRKFKSGEATESDEPSLANDSPLDVNGKKRVRWARSSRNLFNVKYFDKEQPPTVLQDKPTAEQIKVSMELSKQSAASGAVGTMQSMEKQDRLRERHEMEKQRRDRLVQVELRNRKLREMVSETPWYPPEKVDSKAIYTIHREMILERGYRSKVKLDMTEYVKRKEPGRNIGGIMSVMSMTPEGKEIEWDDSMTPIVPSYSLTAFQSQSLPPPLPPLQQQQLSQLHHQYQQPNPYVTNSYASPSISSQLQGHNNHGPESAPPIPSDTSFIQKLKSALRDVPSLPNQPPLAMSLPPPQQQQQQQQQPQTIQYGHYENRDNNNNNNNNSYHPQGPNSFGRDFREREHGPPSSTSLPYGFDSNNNNQFARFDPHLQHGGGGAAGGNFPPSQFNQYQMYQEPMTTTSPQQQQQQQQQQLSSLYYSQAEPSAQDAQHYNYLIKGITNKDHPLYKTVRCRFFDPNTKIGCRHGDDCPYYHAGVDPPPRDGIVREPIPTYLQELKKRMSDSGPSRPNSQGRDDRMRRHGGDKRR